MVEMCVLWVVIWPITNQVSWHKYEAQPMDCTLANAVARDMREAYPRELWLAKPEGWTP